MGSRGLLLLKVVSPLPPKHQIIRFNSASSEFPKIKRFSVKATNANGSSLPPPDVPRLAETARISLNPHEVEEFAPKIRQVIDWFGQLQVVDLNSVEPTIRADTEGEKLRDDVTETFNERAAIIAAIPSYEKPYVKVPKVLNKE